MKRFINKKLIIITSVVLLFLVAVGTTLAYIFTKTEPVENTFNPSKVSCAVVEDNGTPVSGAVFETGETKTNVQIKNTGDTDAYIRVAVVVNWASENGSRVWATKPEDDDYTITFSDDGWFEGGDGFYYYSEAISPENLTNVLIEEAKLNDNVTPPVGTDGTHYYLSIEIIASAIQSTPETVVEDEWGVTVDDESGTLAPKAD